MGCKIYGFLLSIFVITPVIGCTCTYGALCRAGQHSYTVSRSQLGNDFDVECMARDYKDITYVTSRDVPYLSQNKILVDQLKMLGVKFLRSVDDGIILYRESAELNAQALCVHYSELGLSERGGAFLAGKLLGHSDDDIEAGYVYRSEIANRDKPETAESQEFRDSDDTVRGRLLAKIREVSVHGDKEPYWVGNFMRGRLAATAVLGNLKKFVDQYRNSYNSGFCFTPLDLDELA
jgi:hypothetical protein